MRGKTRYLNFLKTFKDEICSCGESEPEVLSWYPHHATIHSHHIRWGPNTQQRIIADGLIGKSRVICANCERRIEHARLMHEDLPFHL